MANHYQEYTSKELLDDDHFIQSMMNPTEKSEDFWLSLVDDGLIDRHEFEYARDFIRMMKKPSRIMTAKERTELWVKIEIENKKALRKKLARRKLYLYSAVASLLIIILSAGFYLFIEHSPATMNIKDIAAAIPEIDQTSNEIQLILPDNEKIELNDKSADIVVEKDGGITVNSQKIDHVSDRKVEKKPTISYNHLIVPFGRHSSLTLSDGTKMHINSGSKVIFPNHFSETERQIFVNGEVYLEVTPNKKAPFYIRTNKMDVQVLGTTVNVTAYEQEDNQAVVLVTGSVKVLTEDKRVTQLVPNQMLDYSNGQYTVSVVDTYEYTSWKDGYFIYRKDPLESIMKQMSRYYGVMIVCEPDIALVTCSGKLDLKEDLDKVMRDLSDILGIDFLLKDNIYTVKKSNNQLKQ